MPLLIKLPSIVKAAGNKPKVIEEFIGRVNSRTEALSVARMKSPGGWQEPGQTPEFDEYTLVLRGLLRVTTKTAVFEVRERQAIICYSGEWVQYSTPEPDGAEYLAVCLPAFSPQAVHRDLEGIILRKLIPDDISAVNGWPAYPPEFEALDYALRGNGWLTEFLNKPDTWCFAAEQAGELVAFTILSKTGEAEAEFRIALRADRTGQGLGGAITDMTLAKGFTEMGLSRIDLIVRKNNPRAIRLYARLGFVESGELLKVINGKQASFLKMELTKASYLTLKEE
jgi:diamine N-acetyltransferase